MKRLQMLGIQTYSAVQGLHLEIHYTRLCRWNTSQLMGKKEKQTQFCITLYISSDLPNQQNYDEWPQRNSYHPCFIFPMS
jgi:hypothetical protein